MNAPFNTGMSHMQNAIEEGKRRSAAIASGGGGKALNYINWKPGDKKILRFLTDDVMTEDFAEFIIDKTGQTKNFMIPPNDPHVLDRYRSPNPGIGWRKNPKTQQIEEPKTRKIGIGLAVLRDEKRDADGNMQVQDYLYDQDVEGNQILSRHFGIVQQSVSNFWHTLAVSCFKRFNTICDRDYLIEREGTGLDTKYSIIPLSATIPNDANLATIEAVHTFYGYGYQWDDNDPDRYLKCPQTLTQWAQYFSSEDRYKHWLVPDNAPPAPSYSPPVGQTSANPLLSDADEAQAGPPPSTPIAQPVTGTSFSSFKDSIISQAKSQ